MPNIMHQVHLTQQSLVFGEQSLVKRIQRQMALKALEGKSDPAQAGKSSSARTLAVARSTNSRTGAAT